MLYIYCIYLRHSTFTHIINWDQHSSFTLISTSPFYCQNHTVEYTVLFIQYYNYYYLDSTEHSSVTLFWSVLHTASGAFCPPDFNSLKFVYVLLPWVSRLYKWTISLLSVDGISISMLFLCLTHGQLSLLCATWHGRSQNPSNIQQLLILHGPEWRAVSGMLLEYAMALLVDSQSLTRMAVISAASHGTARLHHSYALWD